MSFHMLTDFVQTHYTEILAVMPAVILLAGLLFTVAIDSYIQKRQRWMMLGLIILVFTLIAQNYAEYVLTPCGTAERIRRKDSCSYIRRTRQAR